MNVISFFSRMEIDWRACIEAWVDCSSVHVALSSLCIWAWATLNWFCICWYIYASCSKVIRVKWESSTIYTQARHELNKLDTNFIGIVHVTTMLLAVIVGLVIVRWKEPQVAYYAILGLVLCINVVATGCELPVFDCFIRAADFTHVALPCLVYSLFERYPEFTWFLVPVPYSFGDVLLHRRRNERDGWRWIGIEEEYAKAVLAAGKAKPGW